MTPQATAGRWALTLYVDGASTISLRAIEAVHRVCEDQLGGDVSLEVLDVHLQPGLAEGDQIVATPTLIKRLPGPPRRIVGELTDSAWLSFGLDLRPAGSRHAQQARGE
jgi:circadian clock protein KaiB